MPKTTRLTLLACACALLIFSSGAHADSLPAATQEILKKLKLDPSILAGLDAELNVPKEWIANARKEGKLRVLSTLEPGEARALMAPFKERYPFLQVDFSEASREDRSVKTLVAYRAGRYSTDVLTGVGGTFYMFKEAGALEDLRSLPSVKKLPEGAMDPEGLWIGSYKLYWCMSYNTKLVRKEDLPKQWEDLITNPRWRGSKIALINRPNLWVLQLWKAKGESWTKDFLTKLFTEVKPQLRKEGQSALIELLAAGEFHAVIPSNPARTYTKSLAGGPLGYTCPEPAPSSVNEAVLLRGAPNLHAGKVFLNWLLSKEGQIAQFAAHSGSPVHSELMRKEFIPFADEILGKQESFRDPGLETEVLPKVFEFWNQLWLTGGGRSRS
jgi:iron(III) transport system substrate-binding protein